MALRDTKGMIYLAAKRLGCDPQTIYNHLKKTPSLQEVINAERGEFIDVGELKLYQAVQNGEAWAIAMVLKTLGKNRGYIERQEHTGKDGESLKSDTQILILGGSKEQYLDALKTMAEDTQNGHHSPA